MIGSVEAEDLTGFAPVIIRDAGARHPGERTAENADVVDPASHGDEVGNGIQRAERIGDAAACSDLPRLLLRCCCVSATWSQTSPWLLLIFAAIRSFLLERYEVLAGTDPNATFSVFRTRDVTRASDSSSIETIGRTPVADKPPEILRAMSTKPKSLIFHKSLWLREPAIGFEPMTC